ncbi:MAG TPA: DUF2330 domain-containing protein, partial [Sandaracinaceae bacterium LLY-WYZ-13_1]|nr:DUF2330 domain-containing protein [Sandaracinaceae bacterium LLY-WYZ-13_1]
MTSRSTTRALSSLGATLALALGAAAFAPSPAAACGGFFCDNSQPVNQQAERIIFAREDDGSVTAVIQIQYQGPSERFAWMLPVAGSPEIAVSSDAAFQRLQQASNPVYRLNNRVEGTCAGGARSAADFGSAGGADAGVAVEDAGAPPVSVVDQGFVGPYDYVIIDVDPEAEDQVAVAITWLQDNGYDVPDMGSDVLRPYLESGMNLLAFRLTKGNDSGAVRPVRLSFGPGLPSIPLRPTAVATEPDLGILVWVLGDSRAIPANYRSLELNEALIDWLAPGPTYDEVVTRAANEAMGQGFVTEMAGAAAPLGEVIWREDEARGWAELQGESWDGREGELLLQVSRFSQLDGMREALEAHVTVPDGLTEDEFFGCLGCYVERTDAEVPGLDPAALLADVQTDVIDPMVETQALFERNAYATRLYTTMSAHEMTLDPIFDFNPSLPDVSNVHEADRVIECSPSISQFEAPWRVELANGDVIRGEGNTWPFAPDTDAMPAAARISRVGTSGDGEVLEDHTSAIAEALSEHNEGVPGPTADA